MAFENFIGGMAKTFVVTDLKPNEVYLFRYCFEQKVVFSDWSIEIATSTTKEPLYAENLHMAIKKQNLAELEAVLNSGDVSPDVQNEDGFTALMAAAKKPFIEGLEKLIEYGADVNYRNTAGKTALMVACTANILDSVKLLCKHHADYSIHDNGGCTAIHWAVDSRSVKLIEFMAEHGADLNIIDTAHGGWTPLIRCATMHGDREVSLALLMNSAELMATDNHGNTALHHSVMRRHLELTKLLLQRRADPIIQNKEGTSPWLIAQSTDDRRQIAAIMLPYVEELKQARKIAAIATVKRAQTFSSVSTTS